ncbi:hypothetical protein K437DRAFT_256045 [Tilletiaria anomala UBC 951]|uniref:Nucleolar complex-associated protein 3 n=1 Tax=Tilletiaria anomala (strain ATCC 24038 / CBS 436.72 / UBC 951) TaxID=1037660 RepID=A0A066W7N4_TILAU|nr:uncharacterized protein K437DRAFT_256045 [Tilletiaria anomala UBC 951]KDN46775.1 hypothetical protein K437DRAFT_256045 [Tilletiaria anomala UBC 951]
MARSAPRRGYRGDPSKAHGGAADQIQKKSQKPKKKMRGPAPIIPMPKLPKMEKGKARATDAEFGSANGDGRAAGDDDEDDEDSSDGDLLDAQDMIGDGESSGSESASEDESSSEMDQDGPSGTAGPSTARTPKTVPNLSFLTSLDANAIGTSRSEQARLKKEEKKRQREEMKQMAKLNGTATVAKVKEQESGSEDYDDFEDENDDLSMGSLSELDEMEDDDVSGDEDLLSGSEEDEESDSQSSVEDGDSDPSTDDDQREDEFARRVAAQSKRKRKEEELEKAKRAKKVRLPVRGDDGWIAGGGDEDCDDDDQDGSKVSATGASRVVRASKDDDEDSESESESDVRGKSSSNAQRQALPPTSDITTSNRFGLLAPYAVMQLQPRSRRVTAAREQIAHLAQNVIADPEVAGLGFLKRMAVFMSVRIKRPPHLQSAPDTMNEVKANSKSSAKAGKGKGEETSGSDSEESSSTSALPVDLGIRAAAIFSLMAVYSDILPGYRIRPLTDAEKEEKVSQDIKRRREFEQGIIEVYRAFLEACERLIKSKHELSSIALKAMTMLLLRAPHFNYRTNIIRTIVSRLSRPPSSLSTAWDADCVLCASTLTQLLRQDAAGDVSLEVVRLLHRMIKERRYNVHANVLDILLHLRLKDELGRKRASTTTADRGGGGGGEDAGGKGSQSRGRKTKAADVRKGTAQHLSKKDVKKMREIREIEKEMREADATIDLEERERNQTETLKLLFVLYFAILKSPTVSSTLLGSAMEGLALYAHRINVDFFRDLLAVLREHVARARKAAVSRQDPREAAAADAGDGDGDAQLSGARRGLRDSLLCLVTAFELLSGQGEALNIDLSDFASHLYGVMLQVSMTTGVDEAPIPRGASGKKQQEQQQHLRSSADLLFRALELLLLRPRASSVPSERAAAFAKRLLGCSLHWSSPTSVIRALRMIKVMLARDARLGALFDGEDRARDGRFDGVGDNVDAVRPLACGVSAWEIEVLRKSGNADVREEVKQLLATVEVQN